MSGTSADAVDAALVSWPDDSGVAAWELLGYLESPLPRDLQQRIHALAAGRVTSDRVLAELASLDVTLGERFAAAAQAVVESAGIQESLSQVVIASHGQTVAHHPELRATLQIGDPSVIAERTGCTTVADFRTRDVAAGGEGAPLAPFFHHAMFADPAENRAILNLGGIANLTWLPPGGRSEDVVAFDSGPANVLMDCVVQLASGGREGFDRDGLGASRGVVQGGWLEEMLDDPYLKRSPPKSTGREHYGVAQAEAWSERCRSAGRHSDDLLATLLAFSVEGVARACQDFLSSEGPLRRLVVGGGGGRNPAFMAALGSRLPSTEVGLMDDHGVPAGAAEAMAFSLMGRNALLGIPNHLPRCTGARREAVLGEIVPGRSGRLPRV